MSVHTPGPWRADSPATTSVWAGDEQIASCDWYLDPGEADYRAGRREFNPREVREANARLIAVAPDLLLALKKAQAGFVELHAHHIGCPDCPDDDCEPEECPAVRAAEAIIAKAEGK